MQIAESPMFHERTKHIDIDCYFIMEKIRLGSVNTKYVGTREHVADLLIKGLNRVQHKYLSSKLDVLDVFASPSLRGSVEKWVT